MISILSTKKLKPNQRNLLLGQGLTLVDYNAIEIEFLDFEIPKRIKNAIFTSQNGVLSILNSEFRIQNCFCVGQKTKALLEKSGFRVVETADYGADLAKIITEKYKSESFYFFCGEMRRDDIPNALKKSNIIISEVKTYRTILKPKKFDQKWDGILFFSPSGVESFIVGNKERVEAIPQQVRNDSPLIFCIGVTTADAAKQYFKKVIVANATSVESVIAKAVKTIKN